MRKELPDLLIGAGTVIHAEQFLEVVMPRFTYTPLDKYLAEISDNAIFDDRTGRMSEMIRWYGFGAWKQ